MARDDWLACMVGPLAQERLGQGFGKAFCRGDIAEGPACRKRSDPPGASEWQRLPETRACLVHGGIDRNVRNRKKPRLRVGCKLMNADEGKAPEIRRPIPGVGDAQAVQHIAEE